MVSSETTSVVEHTLDLARQLETTPVPFRVGQSFQVKYARSLGESPSPFAHFTACGPQCQHSTQIASHHEVSDESRILVADVYRELDIDQAQPRTSTASANPGFDACSVARVKRIPS